MHICNFCKARVHAEWDSSELSISSSVINCQVSWSVLSHTLFCVKVAVFDVPKSKHFGMGSPTSSSGHVILGVVLVIGGCCINNIALELLIKCVLASNSVQCSLSTAALLYTGKT